MFSAWLFVLAQTADPPPLWSQRLSQLLGTCWLLLGLATMAWMIRLFTLGWREEQRRRQGRCVFCGYDLRATPDRCPECGAAPPHPADTNRL